MEDRVSAVSAAGDVNGDGFDDVLYGTRTADTNGVNSGTAYVVFGRSTFNSSFLLDTLDGSNGFRINGKAAGDLFGESVSEAGDVNRDGYDDIIIGASGVDGSAGESYVIFGGMTFEAILDLTSLDGGNGFSVPALESGDLSGKSVAHAGDVNGDGFSDVIIGAVWADPGGVSTAGQSYVIFGRGSFGASFDLSTLDGSNGFFINGVDDQDSSGIAGNGGDHNGDGVDDIIIGVPGGEGKALNNSGEAYVVFGEAVFDWLPPGGGDFTSDASWSGGIAPSETGGVIKINPLDGGVVTAAGVSVEVDHLNIRNGNTPTTVTFESNTSLQITRGVNGDGILEVAGNLALGSSAGTVMVETDLTLQGTAITQFEIDGTNDGRFDKLILKGAATLNGALVLTIDPGVSFTDGEIIEIADMQGSLTGTFTGLAEGALVTTFGFFDLFISYQGGDGNDITLTADEFGPFDWALSNGGLFAEDSAWRGGAVPVVADTMEIAPAAGGTITVENQNLTVDTLTLLDGTNETVLSFDALSDLQVAGGVLGNGELVANSTFSLGDNPATVTVDADLTFGNSAQINLKLNGTGPGEFDQLILNSTTSLDGQLILLLDDGFTPSDGDTFLLLDVRGDVSGAFDSFPEGSIIQQAGLMDLFISYNGGDGNDIVLTALASDPFDWEPFSGGSFAQPANWRGGAVPNNLDDFVFAPENGGTVTVSDFDLAVGNLTFDDGFSDSILRIENSGNLLIGNRAAGTGEMVIAGGLAIGDPLGIASVETDLTFEDSGRLEIEIGGVGEGQFDRVILAGHTNLNGALDVQVDPGFNLTGGDTFLVGDVTGEISGTFSEIPEGAGILTSDPTGFNLVITYQGGDGNDIELNVVGSFWDDAKKFGTEWRFMDWLGHFYVREAPWLYHLRLGWFYDPNIDPLSLEGRWLYLPELGWLWTSESLFPFLYRHSSSNWLYFRKFQRGTTFFDYATNTIIEIGNE